jgi:beta-phosphoglucomutase-like phosphatase (HAD superfamily)
LCGGTFFRASSSLVKEKHREEILTFVFDHDREAYELFGQKEPELLPMAPGLREFLIWINAEGIRPCVVSELKKTLGPVGTDMITKFLIAKGIIGSFQYFITPHGKMAGMRFRGWNLTPSASAATT